MVLLAGVEVSRRPAAATAAAQRTADQVRTNPVLHLLCAGALNGLRGQVMVPSLHASNVPIAARPGEGGGDGTAAYEASVRTPPVRPLFPTDAACCRANRLWMLQARMGPAARPVPNAFPEYESEAHLDLAATRTDESLMGAFPAQGTNSSCSLC